MKYRFYRLYLNLILGSLFIQSCDNKSNKPQEGLTCGSIDIMADESFKPLIEEQEKVFEASFPNAHLNIQYASQVECEKALFDTLNDVRMVIMAKTLNKKQQKWLKVYRTQYANVESVARDGIALIVNKQSPLEKLSYQETLNLFSDKGYQDYYPILDGKNMTSNLYLIDSLVKGKLNPKMLGAKSNLAVIDAVAQDPKAVGVLGFSWISNANKDSKQAELFKKMKILAIECIQCDSISYLTPTQADVATKRYPLNRDIYIILNDRSGTLASGFRNFMMQDRGQLIFRHAGVMPTHFPYTIRKVNLK